MEFHKILFCLFFTDYPNMFLRHNSSGKEKKKKSCYFLLFYLITHFSHLILMGFFTFILGGWMPTNLCTQLSKEQDVTGWSRNGEIPEQSGNTSTAAHPKIVWSSQAGQLSPSSADSAAELLLPACRDTRRSLAHHSQFLHNKVKHF